MSTVIRNVRAAPIRRAVGLSIVAAGAAILLGL